MSMNIKDAIEEYMIASQADGKSQATLEWYASILKRMANGLIETDIYKTNTRHLRVYIIDIRDHYDSYDTQQTHIRAMHAFWRWCSQEYRFDNPMSRIAFPKPSRQKSPKAVSEDDVVTLFNFAGEGHIGVRNRAIMALLYDTGCRRSGIVTALMDELDMENMRMIVHEKGRKTRAVNFTEITVPILQEWLDIRSPRVETIFYSMTTFNPLTGSGLTQMFKRLKKKAGLKGRISPHAFRHAFAREYLLNGGDLETLRKILGHETIETVSLNYAVFTEQEAQDQHGKFSPMGKLAEKLDKQG